MGNKHENNRKRTIEVNNGSSSKNQIKNGNKNHYSNEEFKQSNRLKWKLDASAGGCSGMFWRAAPSMHSTVSAIDWPRNGTIFYGWKSVKNPGWIKVDNPKGYWLPIEQHGKTVSHLQSSFFK